ncbi:uncharacterized protein LOC116248011 [Nymphaea colorata]|uniref:BAG domain-containing protein n=1 Tax=Nymphaea colorata TaxID=210225 RepID=A0A5K1AIU0_9MAGN|nr:uncharacterized protein LOC116248011 [Nymphaea colorata]
MESTHFRKPWRSPAVSPYYSPAARSVPVRSATTMSPKVVSIPVHFVANESQRLAAAVMIQSAFKGYVVRKNVRKIARASAEADRLGQAISEREMRNLLRDDPKERLRMNESLMSLLLQLDSVRGVDPGVRDLRKAATRRVIALQEAVDLIPSRETEAEEVRDADGDGSSGGCTCEDGADETLNVPEHVDACGAGGTMEEACPVPVRDDVGLNLAEGNLAEANLVEASPRREGLQQCCNDLMEEEILENDGKERPGKRTFTENEESSPQGVEKTVEPVHNAESIEVPKCVHAEEDGETKEAMEIQVIESTVKPRGDLASQGDQITGVERAIELVMAENKRLRSLVAELCERNIVQSRLMSSLAERVDQLEKTARQQELKKKKKKKQKLAVNLARTRTP